MQKYILIGDGGHTKVITDCIVASGNEVIARLDDKYSEVQAGPVYSTGPIAALSELMTQHTKVIIAIGNNKVRYKIANELALTENQYGTAIHPSAVVSPSAKIGVGTVIMPNAVVNADAVIGAHAIINSGAIVEHDCQIEDYVHIAPGAVCAGGAHVEIGAHIAPNATVNVLAKVKAWEAVAAGQVNNR